MRNLWFIITLLYSVTLSAQERITLLFVGDLMQHQAQIDAARGNDGEYHYETCFEQVKEQIEAADIAVGNLEVTLGGKPYRGYPCFSAPDAYLKAIKEAGFDVMLTANNHCLDRGSKGLKRTIEQLDAAGMAYTGTYTTAEERKRRSPLLIEKKGFRIVFLNYTYGTNGLKATPPQVVNYIDKEVMQEEIAEAKRLEPDAIIACMHWGWEYKLQPNKEQKELADWLLMQGVTHVIGGHPHVVQPYEVRDNGCRKQVVAYSLGNFISNMKAPNTDGGMMLTLTLEKLPSPTLIQPSFIKQSYAPEVKELFTPICRLVKCEHTWVWTVRPEWNEKKNFMLIPLNKPIPPLPAIATLKMKRFQENAEKILTNTTKK